MKKIILMLCFCAVAVQAAVMGTVDRISKTLTVRKIKNNIRFHKTFTPEAKIYNIQCIITKTKRFVNIFKQKFNDDFIDIIL